MRITHLIFLSTLASFCSNSNAEDVTKGREYETCNTKYCNPSLSTSEFMESPPLEGEIIIGETFFVSEEFPKLYKTAFQPKKVISVYNPSTGEIFENEKDYSITQSGILILPGSKINEAPAGFLEPSWSEMSTYGVKVSNEFKRYQYAVTYKKEDFYHIKKVGFIKKPKEIKKMRLTFFGDSISYGSDTTHGYVNLVMSTLEKNSPGRFMYRNNSVPEISSLNASWWIDTKLNDKKSDIIVLAFGMNDSNNITPTKYKANLESIIKKVRLKNHDTQFILISPIRPNPKSKIHNHDYFNKYAAALKDIAIENDNVMAIDLTSAWDRVNKNKRFYDLTANGLHSPNDYAHRVIADVVYSAMKEI
ncbi:SGNH/GDSL hydrolase family protein [Pseudomonas sp. Au-Pse12]|uniref:SGNH/GDSL hydrolase family protein n=1 Tax=Pseudomonas sp. Au-Pse12 TaxID=2906459 RepID=UPI001E5CC1F9|nr:GDSL-type esterase/lipase family protein [Pseudomonas sp. Au-Pse12]MCE4055673.1 GDSL-type esterase/lipase family protein [Pseudomonas sp. Au-Pse12]